MSPIFPRVSTFSGVALFQPAPRQKRGRSFFASQTERNSIIDFSPTNSPLPPLSIHPKPLDIYRSAKVLLGFLRPNWQFRLSGISGAPFYSTPEFRLSSSFRAAPLFKVGNTLPTFLLKSSPPPTCPPSDAGGNRIGFASLSDIVLHFAVWSRSRGMKHREILSKNENFSCIDNIPPSAAGEGMCSLSNTFCYRYICVKKISISKRNWKRILFFFFFFFPIVTILILLCKINFVRLPFHFSPLSFFMKIA